MPSAVIDVNITWTETKILKEKREGHSKFEGFHAQLDYKLTYEREEKTRRMQIVCSRVGSELRS